MNRISAADRRDQEILREIAGQGKTLQEREALSRLQKDREELLLAQKPWSDFIDLLWGGQPTEEEAVAVLKPEDLPLVRILRRMMIAGCNQHAIGRYNDLTALLMTLAWKRERVH